MNQSKPNFGPDCCHESMYGAAISSKQKYKVTLDLGIQGNHAGGLGAETVKKKGDTHHEEYNEPRDKISRGTPKIDMPADQHKSKQIGRSLFALGAQSLSSRTCGLHLVVFFCLILLFQRGQCL